MPPSIIKEIAKNCRRLEDLLRLRQSHLVLQDWISQSDCMMALIHKNLPQFTDDEVNAFVLNLFEQNNPADGDTEQKLMNTKYPYFSFYMINLILHEARTLVRYYGSSNRQTEQCITAIEKEQNLVTKLKLSIELRKRFNEEASHILFRLISTNATRASIINYLSTTTVDPDAYRPLHYALDNGKTEAAKALISFDYTDLNIANIHGETPYIIACARGYSEIVRMLIDKPRLDKTIGMDKAMYQAAMNGHLDIIKIHLEHRVSQLDLNSILMTAVQHSRTQIVRWCLEEPQKSKIDFNTKNYLGNNALMIAAKKNNADIFRMLWQNGKTDKTVANKFGETVLHLGVESRLSIDLLLSIINEPGFPLNAQEFTQGDTALTLAQKIGNRELIDILQKKSTSSTTVPLLRGNLKFRALREIPSLSQEVQYDESHVPRLAKEILREIDACIDILIRLRSDTSILVNYKKIINQLKSEETRIEELTNELALIEALKNSLRVAQLEENKATNAQTTTHWYHFGGQTTVRISKNYKLLTTAISYLDEITNNSNYIVYTLIMNAGKPTGLEGQMETSVITKYLPNLLTVIHMEAMPFRDNPNCRQTIKSLMTLVNNHEKGIPGAEIKLGLRYANLYLICEKHSLLPEFFKAHTENALLKDRIDSLECWVDENVMNNNRITLN